MAAPAPHAQPGIPVSGIKSRNARSLKRGISQAFSGMPDLMFKESRFWQQYGFEDGPPKGDEQTMVRSLGKAGGKRLEVTEIGPDGNYHPVNPGPVSLNGRQYFYDPNQGLRLLNSDFIKELVQRGKERASLLDSWCENLIVAGDSGIAAISPTLYDETKEKGCLPSQISQLVPGTQPFSTAIHTFRLEVDKVLDSIVSEDNLFPEKHGHHHIAAPTTGTGSQIPAPMVAIAPGGGGGGD